MKRWLLKVNRYGGGSSVLRDYDNRDDAKSDADLWNEAYQTDTAYVEENHSFKGV